MGGEAGCRARGDTRAGSARTPFIRHHPEAVLAGSPAAGPPAPGQSSRRLCHQN